MAYANIPKFGLYQDDYREWSQKPRLEKTWRNFKAHFTIAFKETQRSSRTLKTEGYADNVQSAQVNAVVFAKMQQYHTMALENLATAKQADITSGAMFTKTIMELSTQFSTPTANLATAQSDNARLKYMEIVWPQPITDIVRIMYRPHPIKIRSVTAMYIQVADKNSTPMGISCITVLRSRSPMLPQLAATRLVDTKNCICGWTSRY